MKHVLMMPPKTKREWATVPPGALPVCVVDNGQFTAACICYNEAEYDACNEPDDKRPKYWGLVPIKDLFEVAPDLKFFLPELAPEEKAGVESPTHPHPWHVP